MTVSVAERVLTLRWAGECRACAVRLPAGTRVTWDSEEKAATCLACQPVAERRIQSRLNQRSTEASRARLLGVSTSAVRAVSRLAKQRSLREMRNGGSGWSLIIRCSVGSLQP